MTDASGSRVASVRTIWKRKGLHAPCTFKPVPDASDNRGPNRRRTPPGTGPPLFLRERLKLRRQYVEGEYQGLKRIDAGHGVYDRVPKAVDLEWTFPISLLGPILRWRSERNSNLAANAVRALEC